MVGSSETSAAFYRELGLAVPEGAPGVHVEIPQPSGPVTVELDAADSARLWNASWRTGQGHQRDPRLRGATRDAVDELYDRLTARATRACSRRSTRSGAGATPSWRTPTAIKSA